MRRSTSSVLVAFAAAGLLSTAAFAQTTKPATQPGGQAAAETDPENVALRAALYHVTIARDVIKETKDGGDDRVAAKTKLNLAMDHLQKASGANRTISDEDPKNKSKGPVVSNDPEDAALPKENHELHVAVRHLTIARDTLTPLKSGGEHRTEALEKVNEASQLLTQSLTPGAKKSGDKPAGKL